MQDLRNLFNQALTAIGDSGDVTDPTADTRATRLCKLWISPARRAVLTAFHWPSVRSIRRLDIAKVRDFSVSWQNDDPPPGLSFAYALPPDCLRPQYLHDFSRFSLSRVLGHQRVCTNTPEAILHYTVDEENPAMWDSDLYLAVVHSLSAAMNMAKSGKPQITQLQEKKVFEIIQNASVNAANSDDTYIEAVPTSWGGTGFSVPMASQTQFFYPTTTYQVGGMVA